MAADPHKFSAPPKRRRRWWKVLLALILMPLVIIGPMGWAYWRAWVRPAPTHAAWNGPLTVEQRRQIFDTLWHEVDWRYSYLGIKQINWPAQKARFRPMAEAASDDESFYKVLQEMLATLKDGHTYLTNYPGMKPLMTTGLNLVMAEGQFVVAGETMVVPEVKRGDVVVAVDGRPVAEVAAELRKLTSASTEAQMERHLAQRLLWGPQGSKVNVTFLRPNGQTYELGLSRDFQQVRGLTFEKREIEGFGYIKIAQLGGDVVAQFDKALEDYRNAPGLILDLRGNGGGNDRLAEEMSGRLIQQETPWAKIQLRFAPFWSPKITRTVAPRGEWQYTGPVIMLIDGGIYSSADFFAGGLARSGRVTAVGSPTGGGSGNPVWLTLPGGAQVAISRWIEYFADGTPVEGNGTHPDVEVRPTIADIAAGRDPALQKAIELLRGKQP
ncbi:MAG TPA: S41 family peptidase [Symbiobacteriaceae bacterium]|nr:S41 family peptidase [Symbiobacteriaceae bacterium]